MLTTAVVTGNAVGLAASVASVVHYERAAEAMRTASSLYAANISGARRFRVEEAREELQKAGFIVSVQSFSEVTVLFLIVIAFVVVGVLSARRVDSKLLAVEVSSAAASTGRALRSQILAATAFVFATFVLRAAYSTMYAIANHQRNFGALCKDKTFCDGTCYNVHHLISQWMHYTPELSATVVLISSPLTLLVVLWSMTSEATLLLMKSIKTPANRPLVCFGAASAAR